MELQEFLSNLEIENTLLIFESGPNQYLRHYTTLPGLLGILDKEKIIAYGYTDSKNNEVAVIRKSGDIKNIEDITNNKSIIGYFEIAFHILNDKVRSIRKRTVNELWDTYNKRIDNILLKYNLINKKEIIKNPQIIKNILNKEDYKLLINLVHDADLSLIKKEGEERIIGSIPLNPEYMTFHLIRDLEVEKLPKKAQSTLKYYMVMYPDLFKQDQKLKSVKSRL